MRKYRVVAIYPGSFDPVTNGHLSVLETSREIFDKVVCAVGRNTDKNSLFSLEQRLDMLHNTVPEGIEVDSFDGLLVDYADEVKKKKKAERVVIVRGIRLMTDLEYEHLIFFNNQKLDSSIKTIYVPPEQKYLHISSTVVRDVAKMNPKRIGSLDVPDYVKAKLKEKYG